MRAEPPLIARRHVFYVSGYDPQGAEGYHRLFDRSLARFLKIWPLTARLGQLALDSETFAHWNIETSGPNWQVFTRYDFLRQEHFVRGNMAEPLPRQIPRAVAWTIDYLLSGALVRVLRASAYFGLVLIYFQLMLIAWVALSAGGAWIVTAAITRAFALHGWAALVIGVPAAIAIFLSLRPLADRWFLVQINNHWPYLCEFARGEATGFDPLIEACAQRVIAAVRTNDADEIIVIGHSGGCDPTRARTRSRYWAPGTAAHPADARLDRPGSGPASQSAKPARYLRAARGRDLGAVDRCAIARRRAQLLGFRSG